jgi:hypothetical protein
MGTAVGPDLSYTRGDTAPITITFKRNGQALDLTGFTGIVLTINTDEFPVDATNQVEVFSGTLSGTPSDGTVTFEPPSQIASDALPILEEAFYDVQWVTAASKKQTPIKGKFTINQDITKA